MLSDVLSNEITVKIRKQPFRHIVVTNLFSEGFYDLMCKEFNDRLALGLSEKYSKKKFWKFGHYDAYCWTFNPETDQKFSDIFYSLDWKKFINGFFDLKLTKNTIAEFHHHKPGSEGGYVHNDYDVSSFVKEPLPNGINPHRHQIQYRGRVDGAIHCVRSIAMLYYFNNPEWKEGDGGETGMYLDWEEGSKHVRKINPTNNKLLAFEISPKSFHAFHSNKKNIRNSMVMWFHSPEAYVTARYGEAAK